MKAILLLLFAIVVASGAAKSEIAATKSTVMAAARVPVKAVALRTDVTVSGGLVRLGDVFSNTGTKATIAIAYAPAPGRQAVLDASWLSETADRHGVDWRPQSHLDQVVLHRASIPLAREAVIQKISEMIRRRGMKGDIRVELSYRIQKIDLPVESRGSFTIRDLRVDRRTGRFAGLLVAPGGNASVKLQIHGRVQKLMAVPVLTRQLRKGAVIRNGDVEVRKVLRSSLPQHALLERTEIVGMAARYTLRAGVAVRKGDVRPPLLVRRGEIVTMEIRTPYIVVTARGRALESGARGDTIRLRNTQSKKTLEARVVGSGRVAVTIGGKLTAAR